MHKNKADQSPSVQKGYDCIEQLRENFNRLIDSKIIRRRHFNNAEREALYIAAGARCQICGDRLTSNWEPDHIIPFSEGGITDVTNGQATCRPCNRAKGARHVEF